MSLGIKQSERICLPAGRYPATLSEIKPARAKAYKSEEEEDVVYFIFSLPTDKGIVEIRKKCTSNNSPKGNLYKFACDLHPDGLISDEVRKNVPAFEATIQSFKGNRYLVTLNVNNGWNNVIGCAPLSLASNQLPALDKDALPASFKDDEIPF